MNFGLAESGDYARLATTAEPGKVEVRFLGNTPLFGRLDGRLDQPMP